MINNDVAVSLFGLYVVNIAKRHEFYNSGCSKSCLNGMFKRRKICAPLFG